MEHTILLRDCSAICPRNRSSHQQVEFVDDECSTDSGCSSGGSTGSAEVFPRRGSSERHYGVEVRLRGRSTTGQERLKQRKAAAAGQGVLKLKSSRSWSPEDRRKYRGSSIPKSPSHSQSPSDTPSSDSDSLKRSSTARSLRKAFQSFKISTRLESAGGSLNEKPSAKKSQKRILRSPVAYTYVKGLSGLPTQRIPRNAV